VLSQTPIFTPLWIALNPPQQLSGRASALNFNPFRNITQAAIKRLFLEKILDRQIVYPGAIPLETDLLNTNKYSMIGAAKLAHTILGDGPWLQGLACNPNSLAALNVVVSPGQIYSLQNIDGTAYSSLAADTAHTILKQGILLGAVTLSTPAPATAGQSVNYLVQITYTDTDSGATVLPYYNSSNPSQAYSGPNNSGTAQNTVRTGACSVLVKAGIAATTGTQVTPAPDSGYIGAYVVTVANGQTTVTAVNIVTNAGAPFITETLTNKISYPSGDARYGKLSGASFTGPVSSTAGDVGLKTNTALADLNATLTAAQLRGGEFTITPTAARILTTDTAANIIANLTGSVDNSNYEITIVNLTGYNVILAIGVGVTIVGRAIISNGSATFRVRRLTSTTVEVKRLSGEYVGVGVGQTWQDVLASRGPAVTYTNSTGKPIVVAITAQQTNGIDGSGTLVVGGVSVGYHRNFVNASQPAATQISAIVPDGVNYGYVVGGTNTILYWAELR
jgi:hypothetical protein